MGKLKQTFTIDLDARYELACEIEGRPLTDDEFEIMCDQLSESIYDFEELDLI